MDWIVPWNPCMWFFFQSPYLHVFVILGSEAMHYFQILWCCFLKGVYGYVQSLNQPAHAWCSKRNIQITEQRGMFLLSCHGQDSYCSITIILRYFSCDSHMHHPLLVLIMIISNGTKCTYRRSHQLPMRNFILHHPYLWLYRVAIL
jgi:hypothetical protein